jgi:hypothetical protein
MRFATESPPKPRCIHCGRALTKATRNHVNPSSDVFAKLFPKRAWPERIVGHPDTGPGNRLRKNRSSLVAKGLGTVFGEPDVTWSVNAHPVLLKNSTSPRAPARFAACAFILPRCLGADFS